MAADSPLAQFRNYVRMVWRFRWLALLSAASFCAIGWFLVAALPNQYEVSTRVYLDTQSLLRPVLKDIAIASQEQENARLISRTLLVRPNLEAVARKTDMDLEVTTPKEFEALIDGLAKAIKVGGTQRSNIFTISYEGSDPKRTYRVVEALLNIFVERSLGESRKDTSSTRQFIDDQIKEYEARLLSAESRLKEFKRQNVGLMPADGQSYFARLNSLTQRVSEANLQLNESRRRVSVLASQIEGVPQAFRRASSTPEFRAPGQPVDPLFQRMQQLRLRLDELLSVYKEKHPDVTAARTMLESLEAEYEKQQATGEQKAAAEEKSRREFEAKDDTSRNIEQSDLIPNPLYQELMLAMGTAQAEMAAMEARVEEYRRRQDELRKLIDTVPKVEAELKRLDRDYSVDRSNYDQLVQRREALKISDDASQSADDVRFNVIEPPREPVVPAGPNRIMFSAVVLVAGIAAGVGFAFLIGLARPAFYGRDDCEQITQLPVLGIVSRVWTRRELFRRRMEVATFAVGCVALLAICIGVLVFHHLYVDVFNDLNISGRLLRLKDRLL